MRVIPQTRRSFLAGFVLYQSRPDKGYSLTDCISVQTMRHSGLTDVLTNDKHFEQEGFRILLRESYQVQNAAVPVLRFRFCALKLACVETEL